MPQNANPVAPAVNPSGVAKPLSVDANNALIVTNNDSAESASLNLTAATVVKTGAGYVGRISVIVAGSAAGTVNDVATTGGAAAANEIAVIPNTVGIYPLIWPFTTGLVVVPGTGQTIAVTYR